MFALLLLSVAADEPAALAKAMLPVYTRDAAEYSIAVESAPGKPCELRAEPVFDWSNPTNKGLQQGAVFVWLRAGRPAALGSIFSQPEPTFPGGRKVIHELHALDSEKLIVTRPKDALNEWVPKTGLARKPVPDAPAPAGSPAARLLQMRRLAAGFAGVSTDRSGGDRLDLRLLPTPLVRYPESKSGVIDGAVFALVSTAGTDPEVLLVIEARAGGWEYACGRFSDRNLYVRHKDADVWASVRTGTDWFNQDADHLYRVYADQVVGPDGRRLARAKVSPRAMFGQFFPVTDR